MYLVLSNCIWRNKFKTIGGIKYDNYNGVITIDIDIDSIDVEDLWLELRFLCTNGSDLL